MVLEAFEFFYEVKNLGNNQMWLTESKTATPWSPWFQELIQKPPTVPNLCSQGRCHPSSSNPCWMLWPLRVPWQFSLVKQLQSGICGICGSLNLIWVFLQASWRAFLEREDFLISLIIFVTWVSADWAPSLVDAHTTHLCNLWIPSPTSSQWTSSEPARVR